jgi:hypothetical protein
MNMAFLIPPSDCCSAATSSISLSEASQLPQPAQSRTFSAILKGVAQNLSDEQLPPLVNPGDPVQAAPSTEVDDQTTGAVLLGVAVTSFVAADLPATAYPVAGKAESLEGATKIEPERVESISLLSQGVNATAPPDDRMMKTEPVPVDQSTFKTADSAIDSLPQPILDPDRSGEASVRQDGARASDGLPVRNDRSAPVALPPVYSEQQSDNPPLPVKTPPGSLITDQEPSPVQEDQGGRIVFPAASVNVGTQSPDRPSAGVQPLVMVQEQGAQPTTLSGHSLLAPITGVSGGGEQDPFGTDAQGAGNGTFFRFGESGTSESATRGNQPQIFNGQYTSAMQAQSSAPGEGSSVGMAAADRLKMTQAFLGEDHSATMTAPRGMAQTVRVDLPSHEAGPLSVRISMTDQTVHTQFTTDRNDLGAILVGRQDQLQQSLIKSGLELGQFQVHVNQEGRQDAFPDRQSRRNGGASEQQQAAQDQRRESQDREHPNHRSQRALSLFA